MANPTGAPKGKAFAWLRTGEEALTAMLAGIEASQKSIRFETYIYTTEAVGRRFLEALVRARERSVHVQVLIDALGSVTLSQSFWEPLIKLGGEFRWFNPIRLGRWSYRDHRKLLVCDDTTSYIGGFNIAEEYNGDGVSRGWRDMGICVCGEISRRLADTFDVYFARADFRGKQKRQLRRAQNKDLAGRNWRILLSDSRRHRVELRRWLVRDLAAAKDIRIVSAYFLPTWRLRWELTRARRRGAAVKLILAGKSDVLVSRLASQRLYQLLLRNGVQIYEYQPQILHAKLFIMDDVVYAGSANMDTRSLRINHELLVRIHDASLATEAREIFARDLTHCKQIDGAAWRGSRTLLRKLQERWAYFLLARFDPYVARLQRKWQR